MPVVLTKRVLELVFLPAWKHLGPFPILLATENPPSHILRFHHKYPEPRYEHVVDLRGTVHRG